VSTDNSCAARDLAELWRVFYIRRPRIALVSTFSVEVWSSLRHVGTHLSTVVYTLVEDEAVLDALTRISS
jgi:hypothetical protein